MPVDTSETLIRKVDHGLGDTCAFSGDAGEMFALDNIVHIFTKRVACDLPATSQRRRRVVLQAFVPFDSKRYAVRLARAI